MIPTQSFYCPHCGAWDQVTRELAQDVRQARAELSALQHATRGQTFQTPDEKDARIGVLEAALRKIEGNAGEIDLTACAQIAREALGSEAETGTES